MKDHGERLDCGLAVDCPLAMEEYWHRWCPEDKSNLLLAPMRVEKGIWDSAKNELFNGVFSLEGCFPQNKYKQMTLHDSNLTPGLNSLGPVFAAWRLWSPGQQDDR